MAASQVWLFRIYNRNLKIEHARGNTSDREILGRLTNLN